MPLQGCFLAPVCQELNLLPVGCLIVVGDKTNNGGVISKLYDGIEGVSGYTVMCKKEYNSGLRTLPCGMPVLRIKVEMLCPDGDSYAPD